MAKKRRMPSVFDEPQMRAGEFEPDPSEGRADRVLADERAAGRADDARVEHTVWDEPALSAELAGPPPEGGLTYRRWLLERRRETGAARSWLVTLGVALAAGPWAVLGAMLGTGRSAFGVLTIAVFGPVAEELMKVAAALYVVEKRPFLFRSPVQIALCALVAGLSFAALENALYLGVYAAAAGPRTVVWRWTVCVALHVGCSLVAGLGLIRVWRDTWARVDRPRLTLAYPYLVAAIVLHGLYNGAVLLASGSLRPF